MLHAKPWLYHLNLDMVAPLSTIYLFTKQSFIATNDILLGLVLKAPLKELPGFHKQHARSIWEHNAYPPTPPQEKSRSYWVNWAILDSE